ncbi:MAG: S1-like domain-containing RNA-binding protein, partial [Gammaproteobacteria bacterium]
MTSDGRIVEIGRINSLEVLKEVDFGIYLDGGDEGEILMPARYVPKDTKVGKQLEAFIYRDSEDRLIATTEKPKVMVGQCAYLKVKAVDKIGAFLDWGLPKDLLVPFNQQSVPMQQGYSYVVYAYLDNKTGRIAASSKLN